MRTEIMITNMHPRGFAFGVTSEGGQIFIPPHVAKEHDVEAGDKIEALLSINPESSEHHRTPWLAIRLYPDGAGSAAPADDSDKCANDEEVYALICGGSYSSTDELAAQTNLEAGEVAEIAARLFNSGRIARALVYDRTRQPRPSFTLWAEKASSFLEE